MPNTVHGRLAALFVATCLSACGGGGGSGSPPPPPPPPGAPAAIAKSAGDAQTAAPGAAESVAPDVLVTDLGGRPVAGATVTFATAAGSGSVAQATATTDANGHASCGAWTLGTTVGSNFLTATVAGAGTVTFQAKAQRASSDITFNEDNTPTLDEVTDASGTRYVVNETFFAFTSPQTTYSIQSATATIGGITVPLAAAGYHVDGQVGGYTIRGLGAQVDLSSLAHGPLEVVYTITDAMGHVADLVVPATLDGRAVIALTAPANMAVVGTSALVQGTCTDDNGPCGAWTIALWGGGPILATGSGNTISATVDLSPWDGDELDLQVEALDSAGQKTLLHFAVFVDSSGHLRTLGTSWGIAKDLLGTRLLHLSEAAHGFTWTVMDTDTNVDVEQVAQDIGYGSEGALYSHGFIYAYFGDDDHTLRLVDVQGSTPTPLARVSRWQVSGDRLVYTDFDTGELRLRDLLTGTTTTIASGAAEIGLGANGDVVYTGASGGVFRWRAGVVTALPSTAPGILGDLMTDGSLVVYRGRVSASSETCYVNDGIHETALATGNGFSWGDCQVADGVVAYEKPDLTGVSQVWRHDGSGEAQLTVSTHWSSVQTMGPDGTILLHTDYSGLHFAAPGQLPGGYVGNGGFTYRNGRYLEFFAGTVVELTP